MCWNSRLWDAASLLKASPNPEGRHFSSLINSRLLGLCPSVCLPELVAEQQPQGGT